MSVLKNKRQRPYLPGPARRAQILDIAKSVFVRRGYRVANVADICREAGIGRGTPYQYFDNKRAGLVAVMEELEERVRGVLAKRPRVAGMPGLSRAPTEMVVAFCHKHLKELLDAVFVDET